MGYVFTANTTRLTSIRSRSVGQTSAREQQCIADYKCPVRTRTLRVRQQTAARCESILGRPRNVRTRVMRTGCSQTKKTNVWNNERGFSCYFHYSHPRAWGYARVERIQILRQQTWGAGVPDILQYLNGVGGRINLKSDITVTSVDARNAQKFMSWQQRRGCATLLFLLLFLFWRLKKFISSIKIKEFRRGGVITVWRLPTYRERRCQNGYIMFSHNSWTFLYIISISPPFLSDDIF